MSKNLKSILYQILGILVVAIIIWGGVKYKSSLPFLNDKQDKTTANKPRPPTPIDSSKVRVGQIQATLEAVGNVRALESIKITSEVNGIISKINFKEGVNVKKGQILIYLESTEQKAEEPKVLNFKEMIPEEYKDEKSLQNFTTMIKWKLMK